MKMFLFLLALLALVATGCQSENTSTASNPLPDQGHGPAAPVGGGTQNIP